MTETPAPSSFRRLDPWPVSIVAFFIVAIAGCVAFVAFCNFHRTDLVSQDYYEQEIRYQGHMEKVARTQAFPGVNAGIEFELESQTIRIRLPEAHAKAQGTIHLYRPSSAGMDVSMPLALDAQGSQRVSADKFAPGLWQVKVTWSVDGQEYFLERRISIPGRRLTSSASRSESKGY